MNRWDPLRNSCAAPEETAEEQLAPKKRRGPRAGQAREARARVRRREAGPEPVHGAARAPRSARAPRRARRAGPGRRPAASAGSPRGRRPRGRRGARRAGRRRRRHPSEGRRALPPGRAAAEAQARLELGPVRARGLSEVAAPALSLKPEALPDAWVCSMNTWDQRFASCEAPQEDEDAIDDGQSEKKLSFREIIFNAEGKYRPPFSERSAVSSIFAVGTTTVNGRTRDVAAYEDSPVYVDAHAFLSPFPRRSS